MPGLHQSSTGKRTQHEGSLSTGRNTHYRICFFHLMELHGAPSSHGIVLCSFDRMPKRSATTRNDPDHTVRRHTKGGWTFTGIQHSQATTGARSDIQQPATCLERSRNLSNAFENIRFLTPDGFVNTGIL